MIRKINEIEMKLLTLEEISKMDSLALTAVIDYWKDYEPKSVILSFAELKKRNFNIPERLLKKQNEFCTKYNYANMEACLVTYFKEHGFNSYEEYSDKEQVTVKKAQQNILTTPNVLDNDYEKYPVLKSISGIFKAFAWIIGIVTIIVAVMCLQIVEKGVIFSLISLVSGGLIVLGVLAVAETIILFIDIERNTRQKK